MEKLGKWSNGKERQYANMGLSCIFKYQNEKGGLNTDLGLRSIFHLLHSLALIFRKSRLGSKNVTNRRLELVCDDDSYYVLVLDKFKMD